MIPWFFKLRQLFYRPNLVNTFTLSLDKSIIITQVFKIVIKYLCYLPENYQT